LTNDELKYATEELQRNRQNFAILQPAKNSNYYYHNHFTALWILTEQQEIAK